MSTASDLGERIADYLTTRCTHEQMSSVAAIAGIAVPPQKDNISKRNRARSGLAGKTERDLGQIARRLGEHFGDFSMEEVGWDVLEQEGPRITEITRRDVAKCFGDDLSGEQNIVELVKRLFPMRLVGSGFFCHEKPRGRDRPAHGAQPRRLERRVSV